MAINYTLNIGSVTKRLAEGEFSNVIVEASFSVSANSTPVTSTDAEGNEIIIAPSFSYSCGGTKSFSVDGLDAANFIDFENVTKETIVEWLLAEEGVTSVEDFSYVKSSIENIAQRIHQYSLEVSEVISGDNPSGSSDYVYNPEPEPEPIQEPEPTTQSE